MAQILVPIDGHGAQAQRALAEAIRIHRRAETIARTAQELGCDRIVLDEAGTSPGSRPWFGSIAQQVAHLLSGARGCQVIGA